MHLCHFSINMIRYEGGNSCRQKLFVQEKLLVRYLSILQSFLYKRNVMLKRIRVGHENSVLLLPYGIN
uniref:Uncharacterized protein n=1 Tax=Arundo donax TaxID=35708 RepID=A0A0A9FAD0_ARUDO